MTTLRKSTYEELTAFCDIEKQVHAQAFINSSSLETHRKNFANKNIVYLSIENKAGSLAGYFILALEADRKTVEFRRIIIDENERGIGQEAIREMELYCKKQLAAKRIWLDVYEDNEKGKHIYEKLGYKRFKQGKYGDRVLFYYEKTL